MTKTEIIKEINRLDPEQDTSGLTSIKLKAILSELQKLFDSGFVRADSTANKWWLGTGGGVIKCDRTEAIELSSRVVHE